MKYTPSSPSNCPYPNLYFEYRLEVAGNRDGYAARANVTNDVFINMLNGIGDLTAKEKIQFYRTYSPRDFAPIKFDYLFSPHISFYDLKNKKHLHKFQHLYSRYKLALENANKPIRGFWHSYSYNFRELDELIDIRFVSRAYYNYVLGLIYRVELFFYEHNPPRSEIYPGKT